MRAVIFDVDGTLIDSVDLHAEAWRQALRKFGHDIPFATVRSQIGKGADQLIPFFLSPDEVKAKEEDLTEYRSQLFKREFMHQIKGFPGVRALFQRLVAEGHKLALASSAKGDELEVYKKVAEISDLIETETSSDDAERSKPYPDIFQAALARLGDLSPASAIVVGDTPYDAIAATRAGIPVVGVLCGGFPEKDLREAGCIELFKDPTDLLARYEQSPLRA